MTEELKRSLRHSIDGVIKEIVDIAVLAQENTRIMGAGHRVLRNDVLVAGGEVQADDLLVSVQIRAEFDPEEVERLAGPQVVFGDLVAKQQVAIG